MSSLLNRHAAQSDPAVAVSLLRAAQLHRADVVRTLGPIAKPADDFTTSTGALEELGFLEGVTA